MPLIRYESLECDLPSDEQQDELMSVHVLIDFGIPWQMNPFLKDSSALLCSVLPTSQPRTDSTCVRVRTRGRSHFHFIVLGQGEGRDSRRGASKPPLSCAAERTGTVRCRHCRTATTLVHEGARRLDGWRHSKMQPKVSLAKTSNLERQTPC